MSKWLWSIIIVSSALVVGLVNFVFPDLIVRPFIMLWFLLVCPGMMLIRFFRLKEPLIEWTLAIALSLAIEAATLGIQVYTIRWSYPLTLLIIISLCIVGEIVQVIAINMHKGSSQAYS